MADFWSLGLGMKMVYVCATEHQDASRRFKLASWFEFRRRCECVRLAPGSAGPGLRMPRNRDTANRGSRDARRPAKTTSNPLLGQRQHAWRRSLQTYRTVGE